MKHLFALLISLYAMQVVAQEKITILNFLQAGAIPKHINERGSNISTSGLSFNYIKFTEPSFFRMDATWLARYILNGEKDSANFNDTTKVLGLDLPVFTATYGLNVIQNDGFSLGLGVNLDSRTFYSSPQSKAQNIIDAFNVGFVVGVKIRMNDWLTYTTLAGYDYMFVDANQSNQNANGNQIYLQSNFSFLISGKFGINIQPDMSFKSFDNQGIHGGQIFNKNIKVGLAYAIP
ncbi:MAG: hypothetical protein R2852_05385 [Bacteroidia bacterium]